MKNSLATYPIKTFDDFRNVAQLYQYSRVIQTALELDLFTAVGSRSWAPGNLAGRLKCSRRGLEILCRNLAALGLLVKSSRTYRNTPFARRELNRRGSAYRGEYMELIQSQWKDFEQLSTSVRTGRPVDDDAPENPKWRRTFTWAMHHRSREQARRVASALDLSSARNLLDLGGGPGTYALAFLSKNRGLRATVADRPAAIKVAREIAGKHTAKARLAFDHVDFLKDRLGGRYDVVWLSNIIHIYSPGQNLALFKKISTVLTAGGRLIIQDSFLTDRQGLYPIDTSAFALTMLLFTEKGNTYALRDVMKWLKQAGYEDLKVLPGVSGRKNAENGVIQGRRSRAARR